MWGHLEHAGLEANPACINAYVQALVHKVKSQTATSGLPSIVCDYTHALLLTVTMELSCLSTFVSHSCGVSGTLAMQMSRPNSDQALVILSGL